jgi:hypothetical protein
VLNGVDEAVGNVRRGQRAVRRMLRPDLDIDFAAMALGAMTERCACLWFIYAEPVDAEQAVDQITRLWLQALGLPTTPDLEPSPS